MGKTIYMTASVSVKDLAEAVNQNPLVVVAELLKLGQCKSLRDNVDFEIAQKIARMYGYEATKVETIS